MKWYEAPHPCKMCGHEYVLPRPYDEIHPIIRDYCYECYLLKWEKLEQDRIESEMVVDE